MKSTNTLLADLQTSVERTRSEAQARVEKTGSQADFADVFMAVAAQRQGEWLDRQANEPPLAFEESDAEVAPHLLARVATPLSQPSDEIYDVSVLFDGDPVLNHAIDISFLGQFLSSLQNTLNALGQWRTYNASAFGRVQQSIIDNNRLLLASTFEGSFGAGLRVVSDAQENEQDDNLSLFEGEQNKISNESELPDDLLDMLGELLDGNTSKATLINSLTQPRVKAHYQKLIELVVKRGADIKFSTRTHPQPVRITTEQARARLTWLENLQTKEEVQSLEGILVGGSIERNRFELRKGDELIEGRMTAEAARSFRRLSWGAEVRAVIRATTSANDETATEKISYQLLGISLSNENLLKNANNAAE